MLQSLRALLADIRATLASIDRRALVVLLAAPVLLTWLEFFSGRAAFARWFGDQPFGATSPYDVNRLGWEWWSVNGLLVFVAVPMVLIRGVLNEHLDAYGLRLTNPRKHVALGIGLYLLVLPAVVWAAHRPAFQEMYPLFTEARGSVATMLGWWFIYLPQFFAVEFFFRGFLLFGLERQCGAAAIFVSTIPYCMVHFHKPMPEAFAAIVAGIGLGYVALRTRCIWSGVLVHVLVALTMDILAVTLVP